MPGSITELKFGLSLIDMPYESRYDWIKSMLEIMKSNKEISEKDYSEAQGNLAELMKLPKATK